MDDQIGFMRLPQVLEVIPISKSAFWAGCRAGKYPAPVKLGPRTTAWRKADIIKLADEISKGQGRADEGK